MTIKYQTFFFTKRRHWSPLNFRWVHFSVFHHFSHLSFYVFGTRFNGFRQIGDHKTPANKLGFQLASGLIREINTGS